MAPVHPTLTPQYNSELITISTVNMSLKIPAPCFTLLKLKNTDKEMHDLSLYMYRIPLLERSRTLCH
jgi:hypothetical protein